MDQSIGFDVYTFCVYRCIPVLIRPRLTEHWVTNWPACTVDRENPRKAQLTQCEGRLVLPMITFWYNFQNNRISSMMYSLLNVLYGWFQSARIPHDWNSFFCCSNASVANWRAKSANEVVLNPKIKELTQLTNHQRIFVIRTALVLLQCFQLDWQSVAIPTRPKIDAIAIE